MMQTLSSSAFCESVAERNEACLFEPQVYRTAIASGLRANQQSGLAFGKILTIKVRRFISSTNRSSMLVDFRFLRYCRGRRYKLNAAATSSPATTALRAGIRADAGVQPGMANRMLPVWSLMDRFIARVEPA